ncbi:MAG: hypothetical protein R3E13_10115 [Alphaproteobacteria bacterium]
MVTVQEIKFIEGVGYENSCEIEPVAMSVVGGPSVDSTQTAGENQSKVENVLLSKFKEDWETSSSLHFTLDTAKAIIKYGRERVEEHRSAVKSGQQKAISGAFCNANFGKVFVELEKMQRESYASVSIRLNEEGGYKSSEYKHMYDGQLVDSMNRNSKSLISKLIP